MTLIGFRITNFRSIIDTGWCQFSPDCVTVLVGQNESGKTSILDALSTTFSQDMIDEDDCRISAPPPTISMKVKVDGGALKHELLNDERKYPATQLACLERHLDQREGVVIVKFIWERDETTDSGFRCIIDLDDNELKNQLRALDPSPSAEDKDGSDSDDEAESPEEHIPLTTEHIGDAIHSIGPSTLMFSPESGLLPDRVDIARSKEGVWQLSGNGATAAANYLKIADVKLSSLVDGDARTCKNVLKRANAKITRDFAEFWSQTIGKTERLQLECEFSHYSADTGKGGKPHLVFWISDGLTKLYPKQRSQGVRWFVSFYLQLKASEKIGGEHVFLLDEPGANLHSKAQNDVLKLIGDISKKIGIVYSTHSPHLIDHEKLYRVLAVQRDGDGEDSPTKVIDAHRLGAASRDTLSPLYTAMGIDLSHQQVIQKRNNVILEEISAFYYLRTFWRLTAQKQEAHFIAATGVDNVEPIANMFLGWGLEFVAVVDDDPHGRSVFNRLKRFLFGDDEERARSALMKVPNCRGIEDIFSKKDFRRFVLCDDTEYEEDNSEHVKAPPFSKPVLAYKFALRAEVDKLKLTHFDDISQRNIASLVSGISERLQPRGKISKPTAARIAAAQ